MNLFSFFSWDAVRSRLCSLWGLWCVLLFSFSACSEEDFSTSPSDQPFFAADTLSFDTLISTIPSSTQRIVLYNPNSKDLLIDRISLKNGGASGFMINVDGRPANDAEGNPVDIRDVELWKEDSLYIFVEARLPEQHSDVPQPVSDEILVETQGVTRRIVLYAHAQDAVIMRGRVLEGDTVIGAGRPHVIYDSLVVGEGAVLRCNPGARLMFHSGAGLRVRGTLVAEGTARQPVVFRGDRMDRLFSYLPYDNTPGQWEGIRFYSSSMGNRLTGIDLHSANTSIQCDSAARMDEPKLLLRDARIHNSAYYALRASQCRVEVYNSLLTNSGLDLVNLSDAHCRMVHCSLLNFYAFAPRSEALVRASSALPAEGETTENAGAGRDTTRVWLVNCLLSGEKNSSESELPLEFEEKGIRLGGNTAGVKMDHATAISDMEHYVNLNEGRDYRYDFHITAENAGIGVLTSEESWEAARECPVDLDGMPRTADVSPDAGCYEYRAPETGTE